MRLGRCTFLTSGVTLDIWGTTYPGLLGLLFDVFDRDRRKLHNTKIILMRDSAFSQTQSCTLTFKSHK